MFGSVLLGCILVLFLRQQQELLEHLGDSLRRLHLFMYYYLYSIKKIQPVVVAYTFDPKGIPLGKQSQARLIYIASSRTGRATQSDPI